MKRKKKTEHNLTIIIEPQRQLCLILMRKQHWGLSLPLINREQNYRLKNQILLIKLKVRTGIVKTKNKGEREERRKERGLN